MIQRIVFTAPISALSLGQVSFNILRELYRRKVQVVFYPIGNPDFSAFKVDPQFGAWLEQSVNGRYTRLDRKLPSLRVWHINGAESKYTDRQWTFTFHETDAPTPDEINIVNQQEETFFSSSWSVDNFRTFGANSVGFIPLGLDEDFAPVVGRLVSQDITHWICVGKWEDMRKMTTVKIQAWIKRYGGNREHQLTLCVNNPFLRPEDMNALYQCAFYGSKPFNVNVLPHLKTNAEMNQLYNSADIDLSGISRGEGWNIPAFTTTALGKWSIVTDCSAHRDWATADNAILVKPKGMVPAVDGIFFQKGQPWSQGNVYDFSLDDIIGAMEKAEKKARIPNDNGVTLGACHTYAKTVDAILEHIND